MATLELTEVELIREHFLCALASKIRVEHNLPRRDAFLVLADSLLDDMNESKKALAS